MSNHTNANVYPEFEKMVSRSEKELKLRQKAKVIWFTGLSGAGKTTLALALERTLFNKGYLIQILDGDNIRSGINKNLGFSPEDRKENIRRIAEIAKLMINCGIICICSFISPTEELRQLARETIGQDDFLEVEISTPLAVCEKRDTKGLYAKARTGEIKAFTGISAPYEMAKHAILSINTSDKSVEECLSILSHRLLKELSL